MSAQRLVDILPVATMRALVKSHHGATGVPAAVFDVETGELLAGAGWLEPCASRGCARGALPDHPSPPDPTGGAAPAPASTSGYRCEHGLRHVGAAVFAKGRHVATVAIGQFVYKGEKADVDLLGPHTSDMVPAVDCDKANALRASCQAIAACLSELGERAIARLEADAELAESDEKYRALVKHNHDGVFLLQDGALVVCSEVLAAMVGYSSTELVGLPMPPFIAPEDREGVVKRYQQRLEGTSEPDSYEVNLLHRDGSTRVPVHVSVGVTRYRGRPATMGTIHDVTKERAQEDALRQAMLVVERSPVVLFRWRAAEGWPVEYVSHNVSQFGYTSDEFTSGAVPYADIVHPDDLGRVGAEVRQHSEAREDHFRQEYRIITSNGEVRWVDDRTTIERDEAGKITSYEGTILDISESMQAEEELSTRVRYEEGLSACSQALVAQEEGALEHALRHLLEAAGVSRVYLFENFEDPEKGLCMRQTHEVCAPSVTPQIDNPDLQHLSYSARLPEWVPELSAGRPIARLLEEFSPEEQANLEPQDILSLLVLPIRVAGSWYGFIGFDDTKERRRWKEQDVHLLETAASIIGSFIEHERTEEQLRQARKTEAVGRLAAGVAHDFNNMLTPILGFADLLAEGMEPTDPRYQMVHGIRNAAEQSRNVVRQLLSYSRKQILELKAVDLRHIVSGMETLLRRALRETITIRISEAPDPCPVRADVPQIEQAILNLALNAQDAMPGGGTLVIETSHAVLDETFCSSHPDAAPGRYAVLTVSDTGHGMDSEVREHVFEPFFTTKEKGKGTGLGLATVYGSVRQHGGLITFNTEPGHGTTFTIHLPLLEGEVRVAADSAHRTRPARGDETIVVVEDNDMVRGLAELILRQQGYAVLSAPGGARCLQLLESHRGPLHLLLTDVVMPDMNGRELYAELYRRYPGLRVLYMSGYTDDVIADHGVLEPGVSFIQKPFSMAALSEKVRETLSAAPQETA